MKLCLESGRVCFTLLDLIEKADRKVDCIILRGVCNVSVACFSWPVPVRYPLLSQFSSDLFCCLVVFGLVGYSPAFPKSVGLQLALATSGQP